MEPNVVLFFFLFLFFWGFFLPETHTPSRIACGYGITIASGNCRITRDWQKVQLGHMALLMTHDTMHSAKDKISSSQIIPRWNIKCHTLRATHTVNMQNVSLIFFKNFMIWLKCYFSIFSFTQGSQLHSALIYKAALGIVMIKMTHRCHICALVFVKTWSPYSL